LNNRIERLHERIDALLEEKLLSRVIRPIIFRGRRIQTAQDVDDVVRQAGVEYASKAKEESQD
jgi:hypothetical protein